jgi:hypothetical protein
MHELLHFTLVMVIFLLLRQVVTWLVDCVEDLVDHLVYILAKHLVVCIHVVLLHLLPILLEPLIIFEESFSELQILFF